MPHRFRSINDIQKAEHLRVVIGNQQGIAAGGHLEIDIRNGNNIRRTGKHLLHIGLYIDLCRTMSVNH